MGVLATFEPQLDQGELGSQATVGKAEAALDNSERSRGLGVTLEDWGPG